MTITINNKVVELKFTFNSFKYMENFNISELSDIDSHPFKVIRVTEELLFGAVNHDTKVKLNREDVSIFLEEYANENSLVDLLTELIGLLEDSSFFRSLQGKNKTETK